MIQPLRDRHRFAFMAVAVVVPVVFVAGLASRPSDPAATRPPHIEDVDSARPISAQWQHRRISVEQLEHGERLRFVGEVESPDPLLYCTLQPVGDNLPQDVVFVGEYESGTAYAIPTMCRLQANWILFSGATHTVIDTALIGVKP